MEIQLGYTLTPKHLLRLELENLRVAEQHELLYCYFLGNIQFELDGDAGDENSEPVPLLSFTGDDCVEVKHASFSPAWDWIPVLDFATQLFRIAGSICVHGERKLDFISSEATISFSRYGDLVGIEADYTPDRARVRLTALQVASRAFLIRVLGDLGDGWPELRVNPAFLEIEARLEPEASSG
ncbi:MAG: hypothetical protein LC772_04040 [Chloroflexi bacterium]|nr:hypothetical protein [Chloroflexota bacterium]